MINALNSLMNLRVDAIGLAVVSAAMLLASQSAGVSEPVGKQATGNQLSAKQKAQLTQLPIPIVAPTYLPPGFRLVSASGEKGQYANGDDDSGYSLVYQGANNTCIKLSSSKDGPRGKWQQLVETKFGAVKVFVQTRNHNRFVYSFIPLKGNPALSSGGHLPNPNSRGEWQRCNPISMEDYLRVLKSLDVVK